MKKFINSTASFWKKLKLWKVTEMDKIFNIYVIIILFVIIFVSAHFLLPLDKLDAISDNFNKVAVGISALLAAYAGGLYFIEEFRRKRLIDTYRKQYSHDKYGIKWKIVVRKDRTGEPHLLEIEQKVKHHIWNMKTIYDLSWQFYDREPVSKKDFDSYSIGNPIRTRGELGE